MVRKWIGAGLDAVSRAAPEEVAEVVVGRAREAAAQLGELAAGLVAWSTATREAVLREVRERMASGPWIEEAGLATRADLEDLRRRVDDLAAKIEGAAAPQRARATRSTGSTRASGSTRSSGSRAKSAAARRRGSGGTAGASAGR